MREVLGRVDHIIVVHTSSKLSSLFETSRIAAQNLAPERITLVDSESVSMGGGWLAVMAGEMIAQGIADVAAIVAALEAAKPRLELWAAPTTLEYLRRSGRVSSVVAGVGDLLQIKPVITTKHGEIEMLTRIRTFKKFFALAEENCERAAPIERMAVIHLNDPAAGQELLDRLARFAPPEKTVMINASAAIGVHFGQGGLGVALYRKM
jgi:DegV family protein with EDD domain